MQSRWFTRESPRGLVRTLEAQGVAHVFGIPGAKIDGIFDALVNSNIETVVCRYEENAAFIAGGIGRMTGKAAVAIATSGPCPRLADEPTSSAKIWDLRSALLKEA